MRKSLIISGIFFLSLFAVFATKLSSPAFAIECDLPLKYCFWDETPATPSATITATPSATVHTTQGGGSVTTPSCTMFKPNQTPQLFQIDTTETTATLHFTPLTQNVTGYYISYGLENNSMSFGTQFSQGPSSGVLSYTIQNLLPHKTYYFAVRGVNDCMPGDFSNTLHATTASKASSFYLFH